MGITRWMTWEIWKRIALAIPQVIYKRIPSPRDLFSQRIPLERSPGRSHLGDPRFLQNRERCVTHPAERRGPMKIQVIDEGILKFQEVSFGR